MDVPADFDWQFDRLQTVEHPQFGSVIIALRWHLICRQGGNLAADYGNLILDEPDPVRFIPEGYLPKSRAIEWVTDALAKTDMDVEARKKRLLAIIAEQQAGG